MFIARGSQTARFTAKHPESTCSEKLVKDGMQCPNVGITDQDPGMVCCLTYFDDHTGCEFKSFFKGTCKSFLCVAWNELTDRQVLFAAKLMRDWYYYSLLINSLELLMELCAEYETPENVPPEILEELKIDLIGKLMEDDMI